MGLVVNGTPSLHSKQAMSHKNLTTIHSQAVVTDFKPTLKLYQIVSRALGNRRLSMARGLASVWADVVRLASGIDANPLNGQMRLHTVLASPWQLLWRGQAPTASARRWKRRPRRDGCIGGPNDTKNHYKSETTDWVSLLPYQGYTVTQRQTNWMKWTITHVQGNNNQENDTANQQQPTVWY